MLKKLIFIALFGTLAVAGCNNASAKPEAEKQVKEPESATKVVDDESGAIHLTKADFLAKVMDYESNPDEWVYKGDKPALIDFYASWCGPCKIASPILDELAKEYKDDIYIYKINTEVERELASIFGIRSIPAFLFVPQEGRPTMSNGIARTPEDTKKMFKMQIDEILLGKEVQESL